MLYKSRKWQEIAKKGLVILIALQVMFSLNIKANEIETVIVETTRSEKHLEDLSLSASVLSRSTIRNADHIVETLQQAAGLHPHRGSGQEHLMAIRSPVLTGGAGAGSFLYLQDGIPLRAPGFANINGLLDAQSDLAAQIEIIRGPSGPIYGANAVHGVINVITPIPHKQNNELSFTTDTHDRNKLLGTVNWQKGNQNNFFGVSSTHESGYREDAGLNQQKILYGQNFTYSDVQVESVLSLHNLNQDTAGYIVGEQTLRDKALRKQNAHPFAFRNVKSALLYSKISKNLSETHKLRLTPFARWHQMEFLQHFLPSQALETNGHRSLGLQSDYEVSTNDWQLHAGIDIDYSEGYLKEFQSRPTIFSFTQGLHYDYEVKAISASTFAQAERFITDNLKATAGLRFDSTRYEYENQTDTGVVGRFLRPADRTDSYQTTSPKVTLTYLHSPKIFSYLSLSRAHRPPQTTDLYRLQSQQNIAIAKAEAMNALELGMRMQLGESISAHLAFYTMQKKNFYFRDADGFDVNNGKTRHRGVELDLNAQITENLRLNSALSFSRHTYDFDRNVSRESEIIRRGNLVDTAPKNLSHLQLIWTPSEIFTLKTQWQLVGEYYTDAANQHAYEGHNIFNASFSYQWKPKTALALSVRNLTNKLYAERADFAFNQERYFPAETRAVRIQIQNEF